MSSAGQILPLRDRVAIITGGSSGIGRTIALHLSSLGARVLIIYSTNFKKAQKIAAEINDSGEEVPPRAAVYKADVSDPFQVKAMFDAAESVFNSSVNIFVNSAAIFDPKNPTVAETAVEDFDRIFAVNARGAFLCCREAANRMMKRGGGGRIICLTTSIVAALRPNYGAYAASKVAVETMVKIMSKELKGTGITANCVAPGATATDYFYTGKTVEMLNALVEEVPLGRLGLPEDISPVVGFLATDAGGWVNGQVIRVNGGAV